MNNQLRVAFISYNAHQYSETFIHKLVNELPCQVHFLYGGELPRYYGNQQTFIRKDGLRKVLIALKEWVGVSETEQHKKAVEQYLLKNKIQLVHANYSITAFPLMEICRRNRIPLVVHFHGWTAYRKTILEQYRQEYQQLFKSAAAVIGVSADMIKQLTMLGAPAEKLHYVPYGVDKAAFPYSDHSMNPPVFLAVGRFCDTKNPHLSILAFSKVLKEIPEAKLVMAGGDETLLSACMNLGKALKIEDKVQFKGVLTLTQVFEEMEKAYAFVQHSATTSLGEKEGTPNAILEACAAGLPVIATRHAGIVDVIVEEETGLLCNEFDIEAMAENIIEVWRNKQRAQQMGKSASERVNNLFSKTGYIEGVMKVYSEVLEKL